MKTRRNVLTTVIAVMMFISAADVHAQSRGRGNENDYNQKRGNPERGQHMSNNPNDNGHKNYNHHPDDRSFQGDRNYDQMNNHDRDNDRRRDDDRFIERDNGNYNTRNNDYYSHNGHRHGGYNNHHRDAAYTYHRHNRPAWAPAYGYRYNTRYIYYQDYNVYYDCHRDQFVVWTGRNWVVSNRIPDFMYRVDFERARVSGVNYWDDDFDFYLQRRRPTYITISANW